MQKEYILCAAICDATETDLAGEMLIYCGHRHNNILLQGKHVSRNPHHQGFLTSTGRYVSREDGLIVANNANQVKEKNGNPNLLFSEDLY